MTRKQLYRLVGNDLVEFTEEEYKAHAERKKAVAKAWRQSERGKAVRRAWLETPKGIACTERKREREKELRRNKKVKL